MSNKRQKNKKRFFYPDEFERLIDVLNKNQEFTATCLINTGARINEARGIRKIDIDSNRKNIVLRNTKVRAKRGEKEPEPRIIAISGKFYRYLMKHIKKGRVLSTNAFNVAVKKKAKQVKIKNPKEFSSHNFRKTFATWMLALGVPDGKLAQHLGHTLKELYRHYATNDVFSHKDKQIMRTILGRLPERF